MKFKYRSLLIRSVALIMFAYITCLALSLPVAAIVDTSRGEGDDYNVTGASPFPMTVGFAFRSSDDSDYNYITATDVGGYGQEYNRTLTGTDEFTYTFDELNENTTTTRYMNYSFGNIYWSSQSLFGYRYGFQPLTLSVETLGVDEACETIVLRAPEVVFNTYAFDFYESYYNGVDEEYDIADLAYLGIPVISAPQTYGPSLSKYVGTCSIRYSVTDQHGNVKKFNYAVPYDSSVDGYIPLLKVDDLYTYYFSIDPAQNSSKILISDWYVFWDVDYYELVDTYSSFSIYRDSAFIGTYEYLVGMTWGEWVDSDYNTGGYKVTTYSDGSVIQNADNLTVTNGQGADSGEVTPSDIIDSRNYYLNIIGGGSNDVGFGGDEAPGAFDEDFDWGASLDEGPSSSAVADTPAAASVEWVKVDSDKRNIVQIGYPLYDTSNGDPDYAAILNYPNFTNYLQGSDIDIPTGPGIPGDSDSDPSSFTRWLGVAVSGFIDVELWSGFSIGGLLAILVSFAVVMMFLKVFAGG